MSVTNSPRRLQLVREAGAQFRGKLFSRMEMTPDGALAIVFADGSRLLQHLATDRPVTLSMGFYSESGILPVPEAGRSFAGKGFTGLELNEDLEIELVFADGSRLVQYLGLPDGSVQISARFGALRSEPIIIGGFSPRL